MLRVGVRVGSVSFIVVEGLVARWFRVIVRSGRGVVCVESSF